MKTSDLPQSQNVEDRRGEPPAKPGPMTPLEALAIAERRPAITEPIVPDPASPLAKAAGVDDIA